MLDSQSAVAGFDCLAWNGVSPQTVAKAFGVSDRLKRRGLYTESKTKESIVLWERNCRKRHASLGRGGVPPLTPDEIQPLASQVEDWSVVDHHHIERQFVFGDFKEALDL